MEQTKKYYIRVAQSDASSLENFLRDNNIVFRHLSNDFGNGKSTSLFSVMLNNEDAIFLKLTFPLLGFLNFTDELNNQKNFVHRCDDATFVLK